MELQSSFSYEPCYLSNTLDAARYRKIPKNFRQTGNYELIFFAHNSKDVLILPCAVGLSSAIHDEFLAPVAAASN
jgi:hypothetical protein